jgi:hypothetical protein
MSLYLKKYKTKTSKPARPGHKKLPIGSIVYLIIHKETKKAWMFCYLENVEAKMVLKKFRREWNDSMYLGNCVDDYEKCLHMSPFYSGNPFSKEFKMLRVPASISSTVKM